jgi:hypothetical protein
MFLPMAEMLPLHEEDDELRLDKEDNEATACVTGCCDAWWNTPYGKDCRHSGMWKRTRAAQRGALLISQLEKEVPLSIYTVENCAC